MKKFFTNLILAFYILFLFVQTGGANELYNIKNANKSNIMNITKSVFINDGFAIKNNDPLLGQKDSTEAFVILQQANSDVYYYYESTQNNLNKDILKAFKNSGAKYKRIYDKTIISTFEQAKQQLNTKNINSAKQYVFEDTYVQKEQPQNTSDDTLKGYVAQIPAGTTFDVYLQSTVNTATAQKGDEVVVVLSKNWMYNGKIIAAQGSTLSGTVTNAHSAGMAYKNGYVNMNFNKLTTTEGKVYNLKTEDIEFKVDSNGKISSVAKKAVVGAVVGALTGLLIGALSSNKNIGVSSAISAGAGLVVGLGSAALEQGTDAEIPTYTELVIKLVAPLNVSILY